MFIKYSLKIRIWTPRILCADSQLGMRAKNFWFKFNAYWRAIDEMMATHNVALECGRVLTRDWRVHVIQQRGGRDDGSLFCLLLNGRPGRSFVHDIEIGLPCDMFGNENCFGDFRLEWTSDHELGEVGVEVAKTKIREFYATLLAFWSEDYIWPIDTVAKRMQVTYGKVSDDDAIRPASQHDALLLASD